MKFVNFIENKIFCDTSPKFNITEKKHFIYDYKEVINSILSEKASFTIYSKFIYTFKATSEQSNEEMQQKLNLILNGLENNHNSSNKHLFMTVPNSSIHFVSIPYALNIILNDFLLIK